MHQEQSDLHEMEARLGHDRRHSTRLRALSANREKVGGIVDLYRGRDVRIFARRGFIRQKEKVTFSPFMPPACTLP